MGRRGLPLVVLGLLGIAAFVAAMLPGDDTPDPDAGDAAEATAPPARGPEGLRAEGVGATPGSGDAGTGTAAGSADAGLPGRSVPLLAERRDALIAGITELGAALRGEREAERTETEEEEKIREEAWSRMVEQLVLKVRADPRQAALMLAEMDALGDEALAIRLARILRRAEHPELLQSMRDRVTGGDAPMKRRTAMLILETRDQELWLEPVTAAYSKDPDTSVRDEAAGFLARSLADRKHIRVHDKLRETIQSGLDSADPAERARALRAMLGDRRPQPADLDRAKALVRDKDESVRRAAARTVRVLEPLVKAALERRNSR